MCLCVCVCERDRQTECVHEKVFVCVYLCVFVCIYLCVCVCNTQLSVFQASWYVHSTLFHLCQQFNKVGAHAFPR